MANKMYDELKQKLKHYYELENKEKKEVLSAKERAELFKLIQQYQYTDEQMENLLNLQAGEIISSDASVEEFVDKFFQKDNILLHTGANGNGHWSFIKKIEQSDESVHLLFFNSSGEKFVDCCSSRAKELSDIGVQIHDVIEKGTQQQDAISCGPLTIFNATKAKEIISDSNKTVEEIIKEFRKIETPNVIELRINQQKELDGVDIIDDSYSTNKCAELGAVGGSDSKPNTSDSDKETQELIKQLLKEQEEEDDTARQGQQNAAPQNQKGNEIEDSKLSRMIDEEINKKLDENNTILESNGYSSQGIIAELKLQITYDGKTRDIIEELKNDGLQREEIIQVLGLNEVELSLYYDQDY